jgi:hypothetical protein
VSRLYDPGVDLVQIGAHVRRWLQWARSGLRDLGAGLAERALDLVRLALGRLGLPPASLGPAFSSLDEGDAAHRPDEK